MDQNITTIILAVITAITSITTAILSHKTNQRTKEIKREQTNTALAINRLGAADDQIKYRRGLDNHKQLE